MSCARFSTNGVYDVRKKVTTVNKSASVGHLMSRDDDIMQFDTNLKELKARANKPLLDALKASVIGWFEDEILGTRLNASAAGNGFISQGPSKF